MFKTLAGPFNLLYITPDPRKIVVISELGLIFFFVTLHSHKKCYRDL